jgi:RND family efflux transporter MFP subunit
MTGKSSPTKMYLLTGAVVLVAVLISAVKYQEYITNPWTRDGQVQATVIQIAPRVTGPITQLPIVNNQFVSKGDKLFEIDPRTYQAALDQAQASVQEAQFSAAEAKDLANRGRDIRRRNPGAMSKEELTSRENNQRAAEAALSQAQAALENARLNLEFTEVLAPVDGYVTNLNIRLGSQAVANQANLALVDVNSYWIDAYFREDLMAEIQIGDQAVVTLMSFPNTPLRGHVSSIAWGIDQSDGSAGSELLPSVAASFEWIRLAQRVPVLIQLDDIPDDVPLRVGTTASVLVRSGTAGKTTAGEATPAPEVLQ